MRSYLTTKSYEGRAISSLILVVFVFSLLFYAFHHSPSRSQTSLRPSRNGPVIAAQRRFLSLSAGANSTIAAHLRELTLRPHLAGTPSADAVADYVLSQFRLAGIETMTREYSPLLSYPGAASISLLSPNGSLIKHLRLAEPADPDARVVPPYHAYSPSGSALAPAVFVGFGLEEDYEVLDRLGVVVKGCVAVVRSGRVYRGAAVERAAARGAKAVLMFGAGDGGGVERGTVMLRSVGDPLTPGWAASVGAEEGEMLGLENEEVRKRFPNIPSMPVAAVVVEEILRTLSGPPVPQEWREGLGMKAGGVGPGPTLVNFTYREDRRFATIRNDFGIIVGHEEPDRFVILGNHRDAWTYGAVDPNSGTAALLDVARRYGIMMRSGWRPRRTIILCSWDAEEFGMIGSTEWVEQSLQNLALKAVAYLNVDCAVQGPGFFAGATPQLDDLLIAVTKQVKDPDLEEKTVYDTWVAANGGISIERLARANSDFSAFLHHAGVSSLDLYFGKDFPVYHTALDCYDWMEKHGDPSFHRHVALAEIWGLLGLHIADDVILPLSYLSYAVQLQDHTNTLSAMLGERVSMQPMNMSIHKLIAAANEIQGAAQKLQEDENTEYIVELRRRALNDRMMLAERSFLEAEGLNGRQWFKHVLYAPPEDYESKLSFFPGVADAISRSKKFSGMEGAREIQHEIWRVARAIERAAGALRGEIA